jgi:2-amino-4-hydroxy-6-hydroxymethyldihydropteridine diphosphokinase
MNPATRAPARAFVALGSNLGDREAHLARALEGLRKTPGLEIVAVSDWIETVPEGGPAGQGPYLNGVLELQTTLSPRDLLARLQELEAAAGRAREIPNGPRTLDLDLLFFGDVQSSAPELTLPHPRLEERLFVLRPLAQIAPRLWLPRARRTVAEQCARLGGTLAGARRGP